MMAPLPPQFHPWIASLDDFHSSGTTSTRIEGSGIVGNAMQNPHIHVIDEDWTVSRKNVLAQRIDTHHPRKGSTCRACGIFTLTGTTHECVVYRS